MRWERGKREQVGLSPKVDRGLDWREFRETKEGKKMTKTGAEESGRVTWTVRGRLRLNVLNRDGGRDSGNGRLSMS